MSFVPTQLLDHSLYIYEGYSGLLQRQAKARDIKLKDKLHITYLGGGDPFNS